MTHSQKQFLIGAALLLLAGLLVVALLLWPDNSLAERFGAVTEEELAALSAKAHVDEPSEEPIPEQIEPGRRVRLAIGSLGLPEQQTGVVNDLALIELNGAEGLEMIERQEIDKALSELQLSAAGLVRAGDAVKAGKLLRADWFLLGTPAVINGTNVAVVRVVDARTGVMHDATMLPSSLDAPALASKIAAFVRQARKDASQPRPRTYLAIGNFEDQGLNNRQAGLPGELRSYLTAAYQGSSVTMLEREFVNTLLQEMYLDLAGLTEDKGDKAPAWMQTAYWMLDGFYQSYETTNHQVELVFRLRRMFAPIQRFELREPPGEPLFRSVKARIDRVLHEGHPALVFSRKAEVQTQLLNGEELIRKAEPFFLGHVAVQYEGTFRSESEMARKRRNAEEAIRSLETVLLLDPANREARIWLATCLRRNFRDRLGEARDHYRHVIEAPAEDSWSKIAREALVRSFDWPEATPESKQPWFENAARTTTNPAAAEFYKTHAKRASERLAEERLTLKRNLEGNYKPIAPHNSTAHLR
jgi:hypothetical protein